MSSLQNFEAPFYRHPTPTTLEGSSEPFGYILNHSQNINAPAPSALAESTNTFTQGCNEKDALYTKSPVYFDSLRSTVGLVCGRENKTKYRVLSNLLPGGNKQAGMQGGAANDILCFTAENGSLHITQNCALLQRGERGTGPDANAADAVDAVILAWPSNVSNLQAQLAQNASSKNIKVLPLLVPPEEIKLEHLRYLYANRRIGAQNDTLDNLLQFKDGLPVETNLSDLFRQCQGYMQETPVGSLCKSLNAYVSLQMHEAQEKSPESRRIPEWIRWIQHGAALSAHRRILYVDWTECTPEEHRIQHVLADIVLRQWHACHSSHLLQTERGGKTLSTIVCDNSQHYLFEHDQSPFIRSLARLSHGSATTALDTLADARRANHNLVVFTESPLNIPSLLYDRMDFLILHRFTSPGWLAALEKHFHLHSRGASSSKSEKKGGILDKIMALDEEHVLLYAPPRPKPNPAIRVARGQQRPVAIANPLSLGNHLSKICLSAEHHAHLDLESEPLNVEETRRENDNGVFGVIGGSRHRNGNEESGIQASPSPPSLYQIGTDDERKFPSKGGFTSNSQQVYLQSRQEQSASSWTWRGDRTAPKIGTTTLPAPNVAFPNAVPIWDPILKMAGSPPSSSSFSPSDAVIARPNSMARISSSSSASASGLSFSFSGKSITPSSSAASGNLGSYSIGLATSPISPVGYFGAPGAGRSTASASATAFSPFTPPSNLRPERERETMAGQFDTGYSTSDSSSRYHVGAGIPMPMPMPMHASPRPNGRSNFHYSSSGDGHARTETNASASAVSAGSRGSSSEYVDVGLTNGAVSGAGAFSRVVGARSPMPSGMENRPTLDFSAAAGSKRSYAGVAAPARDSITSPQRRDTVVPSGNLRPSLNTQVTLGLGTSSASVSGPSSSSDLISPSSSDPPPPPPIYPESFFWPLLDALEKSRAQVSTAHNRAQSVRHSVVGQELPQSARQRLGLTFKEYVAAASRQGIIVTGDSGDKAWIAMRDWKYPGKSFAWVSSPR